MDGPVDWSGSEERGLERWSEVFLREGDVLMVVWWMKMYSTDCAGFRRQENP